MSLEREKHIDFIIRLMKNRECFEYFMTLPIRTNNYYWGIAALYLLGGLDRIDRDEAIEYIYKIVSFTGNRL